MKNASGQYTAPTPVDVASALAYATQQPNGTHQLNFNGVGPHVYNPSTYSYLLTPTTGWSPAKGETMSQFVNYVLTLGQQAAPTFGYASLGLSLEQYGINAVTTNVPGAVAPTAAEKAAYSCGDLTPSEVAAGQTTPTCGMVNQTAAPPKPNSGTATGGRRSRAVPWRRTGREPGLTRGSRCPERPDCPIPVATRCHSPSSACCWWRWGGSDGASSSAPDRGRPDEQPDQRAPDGVGRRRSGPRGLGRAGRSLRARRTLRPRPPTPSRGGWRRPGAGHGQIAPRRRRGTGSRIRFVHRCGQRCRHRGFRRHRAEHLRRRLRGHRAEADRRRGGHGQGQWALLCLRAVCRGAGGGGDPRPEQHLLGQPHHQLDPVLPAHSADADPVERHLRIRRVEPAAQLGGCTDPVLHPGNNRRCRPDFSVGQSRSDHGELP